MQMIQLVQFQVDRDQIRVLGLLRVLGPMDTDTVANFAKLDLASADSVLTRLHGAGKVRRRLGKWCLSEEV